MPVAWRRIYLSKKVEAKKEEEKKSRTQTVKKARMCKRYERLSILKKYKTETSAV